MFDNFDFTDFWYDNNEARPDLSEKAIEELEKKLGYRLPASYIWLIKNHGSGSPNNDCIRTNTSTSWSSDHVAITSILDVDQLNRFMIHEWDYPDIGIAICDCPSGGHDMIFLDYRKCGPFGEPEVVHIDQECDYRITYLAKDFEELAKALRSKNDESDND